MMKIALDQTPIWWFRSACVIAGGIGLLSITAVTGGKVFLRWREIPALLLCAVFAIVGWHLFTGYGITLMPAGRASIIAYTMPLWAALFSIVVLRERLTGYVIAGLLFGLAGLAVLIGPDLVVLQTAPLGALFMLAAALSWGFGTVLFKRFQWSTPVAATVGWQLIAAAAPITIGAILLQPMPDVTAFRPETIGALAYVFLLPMIFGQWAFYKIVHLFSATIAAIGTMAVPVIGVVSSLLIIGETIGDRDLIALALIVAALASVLVLPSLKRSSA